MLLPDSRLEEVAEVEEVDKFGIFKTMRRVMLMLGEFLSSECLQCHISSRNSYEVSIEQSLS